METYEHCAGIVRAADRDRFLADLYAPPETRRHLFALHAFNAEVARIRDAVSEPALGEIRLQWWRDALHGDAGGHPVAMAVKETIAALALPIGPFDRLLDARAFDLYNDPMPSLTDLEGHAGDTSSALMQLGAIILAGGGDPRTADLAGHAGVASAVTGLMRSLPVDASRRRCYLPADLVAKHGADLEDMFAGRTTPALKSVLAELRSIVRGHLEAARTGFAGVDAALLPAFLPAALVAAELRLMEGAAVDPLHDTVAVSPVRRQWILWRAARSGRI